MHSGEGIPINTIYLLTLCLPLVTVLIVFGLKYGSAIYQARMRLSTDAQYYALAEKAVVAESENLTALQAMRSDLSKVAASLAAIEKVLEQVQ
jgi:hypothetical protein